MNCLRAAKMIPLYAGGELSDKKARRLERHLAGCSACRKAVEEFRAALAGLRTAARRDEYDWPEAEWKSLMSRIKSQTPSRRAVSLGIGPIPAWAYGAAALLIVGLALVFLRTRLFPPAAYHETETLASTEILPGRALEFPENRIPRPRQDMPFRVQAESQRPLERQTLTASATGGEAAQDLLSMTLVSQETGLKVHWTFNRNFEWKEEEKR
jgi:hypothetical protein